MNNKLIISQSIMWASAITVILGASNENQLENNLSSIEYLEKLENQDLVSSLNSL